MHIGREVTSIADITRRRIERVGEERLKTILNVQPGDRVGHIIDRRRDGLLSLSYRERPIGDFMEKELRDIRTNQIAGSVTPKNCGGGNKTGFLGPTKVGET